MTIHLCSYPREMRPIQNTAADGWELARIKTQFDILTARIAELERQRDHEFNMRVDYDNKLREWQELTGCSCPSECRRKLGLPE